MPSSKVWRKGRWFWSCKEGNDHGSWKDSSFCGAQSKTTYSTYAEAYRAGQRHAARNHRHEVAVSQVIGKRR